MMLNTMEANQQEAYEYLTAFYRWQDAARAEDTAFLQQTLETYRGNELQLIEDLEQNAPRAIGWGDARRAITAYLWREGEGSPSTADELVQQWHARNFDTLPMSLPTPHPGGHFHGFYADMDAKYNTQYFSHWLQLVNLYETEMLDECGEQKTRIAGLFESHRGREEIVVNDIEERLAQRTSVVRQWVMRFYLRHAPAKTSLVESIVKDHPGRVCFALLRAKLIRKYDPPRYIKATTWGPSFVRRAGTGWDLKWALFEFYWMRDVRKLRQIPAILDSWPDRQKLVLNLLQLYEPEYLQRYVQNLKGGAHPCLFPPWRNDDYPAKLRKDLTMVPDPPGEACMPAPGEKQPDLQTLSEETYPEWTDVVEMKRRVDKRVGEAANNTTPSPALSAKDVHDMTDIPAANADARRANPDDADASRAVLRPTPSQQLGDRRLSTGGNRSRLKTTASISLDQHEAMRKPPADPAPIAPRSTTAPHALYVEADAAAAAAGLYLLVEGGEVRKQPYWRQAASDKVIYSGATGKWLVGTQDTMQANKGWARSVKPHNNFFPHEVTAWQTAASNWAVDKAFRVFAIPRHLVDGLAVGPAGCGTCADMRRQVEQLRTQQQVLQTRMGRAREATDEDRDMTSAFKKLEALLEKEKTKNAATEGQLEYLRRREMGVHTTAGGGTSDSPRGEDVYATLRSACWNRIVHAMVDGSGPIEMDGHRAVDVARKFFSKYVADLTREEALAILVPFAEDGLAHHLLNSPRPGASPRRAPRIDEDRLLVGPAAAAAAAGQPPPVDAAAAAHRDPWGEAPFEWLDRLDRENASVLKRMQETSRRADHVARRLDSLTPRATSS